MSRCRILYIENSEADRRLMTEVVSGYRELSLTCVATGEDALKVLADSSIHDRPNLVLMSWFLPSLTGKEVLEIIKSNPHTKALPVIVVTGILIPQETVVMYELGASCVIDKPLDLDTLVNMMAVFAAFWGTVATLPFCKQ